MPLFPFFLVNLLMGLTRLRVRHYWWVSQLAMLPATVIYLNAGRELETHLAARYSVAGTAVRLYTIRVITAGHSLAVFPLHPFD